MKRNIFFTLLTGKDGNVKMNPEPIRLPFTKMNPFDPASLSPIPKTSHPCALPYDLTWDDLRVALPGFEAQSADQAQAFDSYEKQGISGESNSCILTLRYPTIENQVRLETVFIKYATDPMKMEGQKYRHLASQGIPTPHLLGAIQKGAAEILMLEFLPTIGIDFHSIREVDDLLRLVAQLNAIKDWPFYCNPVPGVPRAEYDERIRVVLTAISQDSTLPVTIDAPRWFEAYQIAQTACASLPSALNHKEFFFQQVGWAQREPAPQLVIFDLETMALSPRFTDLAGILGPLAAYSGRDQVELLKVYYSRLCALGRLELSFDQALYEFRLVRIVNNFWSLPWLFDAGAPKLSEMLGDTPELAVLDLYHDLTVTNFLR